MLAVSGKTDFATVFPDLMKDWDSEKNVGLDPTSLLPQSEKIVNWKCHHCGYRGTGAPAFQTAAARLQGYDRHAGQLYGTL